MKVSDWQKDLSAANQNLLGEMIREIQRAERRQDGTDSQAFKDVQLIRRSGDLMDDLANAYGKAAAILEKAVAAAKNARADVHAKTAAERGKLEPIGQSLRADLRSHISWVRWNLVKGKYSPDLVSSAQKGAAQLQKLELELDKMTSKLLELPPPLELPASKFVPAWKTLAKKYSASLGKVKDAGLLGALGDCDSNHEFDEVGTLCSGALNSLATLRRNLPGADKDLNKALDKFADTIEDYSEKVDKMKY